MPAPSRATWLARVAVLLLAAPSLAACSGGGSASGPGTSVAGPGVTPTAAAASGAPPDAAAPVPTPTQRACPQADRPTGITAWPEGVPPDIPVPPTAVQDTADKRPDGLIVVTFTTTRPLRDGLETVVRELPAAGYTLGRGDAEPLEADVPFSNGPVRGTMRLVARTDCDTVWLLAVAVTDPDGDGPRLPVYTPRASPSPLPFG